jgi:hypothetical protein
MSGGAGAIRSAIPGYLAEIAACFRMIMRERP